MRIRTIKPEFWMNETLAGVSAFSRLLAIALLNWADDEGYFLANPALLRGSLFPFEENADNIKLALHELAFIGYLQMGTDDDGRPVGFIVNFTKHQKIDRKTDSKIKPRFILAAISSSQQRGIAPGMEGKGREQSLPLAAEAPPKKPAEPADPRFKPFIDAFCTEYEKATGHKYAVQGQKDGGQLKRLLKALPDVQIDEWCHSLEWCRQVAKNDVYAKSCVKTTGSLAAFAAAWPQILDYSQNYSKA